MRKKFFLLVSLLCLMFSLTAFASNDDFLWEKYTDINYKSKLLPAGADSFYTTNQRGLRGENIAVATISFKNLGDGYMYFSASTSSHTYCDRIRMKIYLDKYNESKDTWQNIKSFTYDVSSEDANGELCLLLESEEIKVEKGYYYRVRGVHTVYQNGESEGLSTYSDGVLAD